MLNQQDINQINTRGITLAVIEKQIDHFIKGFPFICLEKPAIPGDGLLNFNDFQQTFYISYFEKKLAAIRVVKFVPASGAASRMFKHLFEFRDKCLPGSGEDELLLKDRSANSVSYLIGNIRQAAFYPDLERSVAVSGFSVERLVEEKKYTILIDHILNPEGLDYASLPKALLKFHQYNGDSRTAAEEHLVEAAEYARDRDNTSRIHFTISPEHLGKFQNLFKHVTGSYESEFGIKFEISFSIQKPSTDTLAVDENNQPVRNQDGSLLFRPGGHGALLENLNEVDADLIFIKNIDNIVPDRLKETTFHYKKLLGGYLLYIKETVTDNLLRIKNQQATHEELTNMGSFAKENLFQDIPAGFGSMTKNEKADFLYGLFNRPIRVCGMVKNEGEPGGGPFWVKGDDKSLSLQIVETSQIDLNDTGQKAILAASTHFNPVDLVCCTKDFEGNTFDLKDFVDENTGFISLKSSGGKTLKVQELPGLWNGAMARWITIFIEVPVITFNPVKTVNDLLRKEHLK